MTMLAENYEYVIGGDPDRDTIDLAVLVTATGATRAHIAASADGAGYNRMLDWAKNHAPGRRVWALEGTGSFAAGLAEALAQAGEDVVEVGGLKRARGAKNDRLDAIRAARTAMAREPGQPQGARATGSHPRPERYPSWRACQSYQGNQRAQEPHRCRPRTPTGGAERPFAGQTTGPDRVNDNRCYGCGRPPDHDGDAAIDHGPRPVPYGAARAHRP